MNGAVILVLFGALIGVVVCQNCHRYSVNGCSIPYNLPYFYKQSFTPSCDRHDVCYECAASHGISKSTCDLKLFNDARAVCSQKSIRALSKRSLITQFCDIVSSSYYEAVKYFGASHFPSASASWCNEAWVQSCLP